MLAAQTVQKIAEWVLRNPQENQPMVDLEHEQVMVFDECLVFKTPPAERLSLLRGLDHIEFTLSQPHLIDDFERRYFEKSPLGSP